MEKIGIIIPAHNEEKRIGATLKNYSLYFNKLKKEKKLDYILLVVINNTQDKTEEIVKKAQKSNKNLKYLSFKQGGKGFAIMEGFKSVLNDKNNTIAGFVDADSSTSPAAFYDLIKNINNFDGIIASRYIKGAVVSPRQGLKRIFSSRVFNFLIRALFLMPYRDTQCGAKIFRREAIQEILPELSITQWAFDVNLLYALRKKERIIKEYPTTWADKEYSKINFFKAGPKMIFAIIRLRLINSKLNFLVRAYDLLPERIKIASIIK